jgi:N-acetylmuramoyl-L-alanine amidase
MNRLADKLQSILIDNGFNVYRNNPDKKIIDWGIESKENNCSLHLALHSNGSSKHLKKGMEIYVNNYKSNMYSLATVLIDNLFEIYPYKEETLNYRGVKEGLDNIGEVDPNYVKNGILFEIAYHDNREDAIWIINNIEDIAKNISNTLIEYYNN